LAALEAPAPAPASTPADQGRKKLLVLVLVAVLVVAGLGAVAYVLLSAPPVQPTLSLVTVTLSSSSVDQLGIVTLTAFAFDSLNNNVTADTNFTWSASPSTAAVIVQIPPARTAQAVAIQAGTVTITASGRWQGTTVTGTRSLTVAALTYELTPSVQAPLVGADFDLNLRVLRTGGAVATSYVGMVHFTSDDTGASLPAPYMFTSADAGVYLFTGVRVSQPGAVQITATDMVASSITDTVVLTGNRVPVASFTITPDSIDPRSITVDGSGSSDPDAGDSIATYTWDFGDGTPVVGPQVAPVATHTYAASGTYDITLTVADTHAATDTDIRSYTAGSPPVASFTAPTMTPSGPDILASVDASASSDADGTITTYNWTWGDGNYSELASPVTSHVYNQSFIGQDVTIVLRVTDNDGLTGTFQRTIRVTLADLPPAADFTVQDVDQATRTVAVDGSASSDPNGNLQYYNWTWGDDTWTNTTSPTASHSYLSDGGFTIRLTVVDTTDLSDWTERSVTIAGPTFAYNYHDFFAVEYGDWWDYRTAIYGDLPIRAECFNATAIADGVCTASDPTVADTPIYPYTNWYPLPGNPQYNNPNNVPIVYSGYRFNVTAARVPEYSTSQPVFLPVRNYTQSGGTRIDFEWRMQYLDTATMDYLTNDVGCPGVGSSTQDGFKIRSTMRLTMDLQSSRRIFGVVGADPAAAQTWWNSNTNPSCLVRGPVETNFLNWFVQMGGSANVMGKYDIYNSFEWYYQVFYLNMTAVVNPLDGMTVIDVDSAAWGTEVVLSRMFYWGNVSYIDNHLNSSRARGWWGMELAWFEEFLFQGSLGPQTMDFYLESAMHYHFQHVALPGPNGYLERGTSTTPSNGDDIPAWTWGPILTDYTNDASQRHLLSELDRYPSPPYAYVHATPGGITYNRSLAYDYPPVTWDPAPGESLHFQFPRGNVVFYDPNQMIIPSNPTSNDFVAVFQPLEYDHTSPLNFGVWNAAAMTWDIVGPATTGGPDGSPGPDGLPGTGDDRYPLDPWPFITLVPAVFPLVLQASAVAPTPPESSSSRSASEARVLSTAWIPTTAEVRAARASSTRRVGD